MLVLNIQISNFGINHPGISCLKKQTRYFMLVINIQVSHNGSIFRYLMLVISVQVLHVGNNHPGISCW